MKRIKWSTEVPPEVRRAAAPLFKRFASVLPTWCHWLTVEYGTPSDAVMTCNPLPEYRQANIAIGEGWLGEEDEARELAVCHEHVHVILGPMANFLDRILEQMPEGTGKAVLAKEWEHTVEGVVCDIAHLLHND